MLEESIFNEESIKKFMLEYYDINITMIKKIDRGSANIYSLNEDSYILKEYQSKYDESSITREVQVIYHLNKKNMPVPKILKTVNNDLYVKYKNHIILVEEFIKGQIKEANTGSLRNLIDAAQVLGKLVLALDDLDLDLPIMSVAEWFSKEKMTQSILKYNELIKRIPKNQYYDQIKKDLQDKIIMLQKIKKQNLLSKLGSLTTKNSHGDYNVLQFIYEEDKIKSVIDFAAAAKMPIVWELIRSYSYMDKEVKNGEFNLDNFKRYVEEFTKYVPLNNDDLNYMPYLYLMQMLHSDYGYKQYIADPSKLSLLEFGFFRTKLCRYLFKNAKRVSSFTQT